jgi:SOS-response transcriptional repressor LexA
MPPTDPIRRLSPRQRQLVETIEQLTAARGWPPSMAEAAAVMRVHRSRIQQLAQSTAAKGWLIREPRAARSWRVIRPGGIAATQS